MALQTESGKYSRVPFEDVHLDREPGDDKINTWKIKRRNTIIVFVLLNFVGGLNYAIILPSLWFYLKQVNSTSPSIFYGLTFGLSQANALLFTIFIGWLVDKTRKVKLILGFVNLIVILGNVIYSIGYSQYIILIGRFLAGLSVTIYSIVFGETARCFEPSELQRSITVFTIGNSFGKVIAPSLNILFKDIDINIGGWHISYVNAGSLLMLILFIVMEVLVLMFVSDLSKEFDLKASLCRGKIEQKEQAISEGHQKLNQIMNDVTKDQTNSAVQTIFLLFKHPTISVIFLTSFVGSFSWGFFEAMVSLIASAILHWSTYDISIAFVGMSLIYIVLSLFIWKISKQVSEFALIVTGIALNIIGYICLCFIGQTSHNYNIARIFYMIIVVIAVTSLSVEKTPMPSVMGKLIPSEIQSLSESVRFSIGRIGLSLSGILSGVGLQELTTIGGCLIVACLINGILVLSKKRLLSNPEPLTLSK